MTGKEIKDYLITNYGECRHDENKLSIALYKTSKKYNLDINRLFHLIVDDIPMEGTHSYGFNTRYGREIVDTFVYNYYGEGGH